MCFCLGCVYTDWDGGLWDDIHNAVDHLLDCGDPGKDTVNGVVEVVDSGRVCLSNGDGCGDCVSRRRVSELRNGTDFSHSSRTNSSP